MLAKSLRRQQCLLAAPRRFASSEYHSLDHAVYEPAHPVSFKNNRLSVFDNRTTSEARYAPFALKETSFKHAMGFAGTMVWDHLHPMGFYTELAAAGWALSWAYQSWTLLGSSVRHVELHNDGKTVTLHPSLGSSFDAKIKDIKKLAHEKTLVETYEEAFLFPVEVNGKRYNLHGNGQESIKHGELFRAIVNGQAIKL